MEDKQRIVSFLPSATEMVCALGLVDQLVGITHECDYPPEVIGKPIVVRNALPIETMTQTETDLAVSERLRNGHSLYEIDEELLHKLAPDLIITQNLCQVCAPSGNEVSQVLKSLRRQPEILWMTPKSVAEIFENIRELGAATGRFESAERIVNHGRARLEKIENVTKKLSRRPRVFCMEWMDPVYCSGHWVPEMVRIAGGIDSLGREGADSVRISWENVVQAAPEILFIMPCGFNLDRVIELAPQLLQNPGWFELPAVRNNKVYAVDANSYFARPGPRVVEGTELLAHLIHTEGFSWKAQTAAFKQLRSAVAAE